MTKTSTDPNQTKNISDNSSARSVPLQPDRSFERRPPFLSLIATFMVVLGTTIVALRLSGAVISWFPFLEHLRRDLVSLQVFGLASVLIAGGMAILFKSRLGWVCAIAALAYFTTTQIFLAYLLLNAGPYFVWYMGSNILRVLLVFLKLSLGFATIAYFFRPAILRFFNIHFQMALAIAVSLFTLFWSLRAFAL